MKKVNIFRAFFIMIPKIVRVSPVIFVIWQILALAHGISYGIIAPITQNFFDKATDFAALKTDFTAVILGLVL